MPPVFSEVDAKQWERYDGCGCRSCLPVGPGPISSQQPGATKESKSVSCNHVFCTQRTIPLSHKRASHDLRRAVDMLFSSSIYQSAVVCHSVGVNPTPAKTPSYPRTRFSNDGKRWLPSSFGSLCRSKLPAWGAFRGPFIVPCGRSPKMDGRSSTYSRRIPSANSLARCKDFYFD